MRYIPEYFDSDNLYWIMDVFVRFFVLGFIFKNSKKTILNLFLTLSCSLIFVYEFTECIFYFLNKEHLGEINLVVLCSLSLISWCLIFKNRYKWRKEKSNNYNRNKVQAIYSKPNDFISLFGAAISLSPKCCVRYTYNDKTIRFKKGVKTPILCETIIQKTDVICDTNINKDIFFKRHEEIKYRNYNLFTFNCRNLF